MLDFDGFGPARLMKVLTHTTTMLLEALLQPGNAEIWLEFDARYRPVVTALARRMGLGDADAEDVAQESMVRFLKAYRGGQYDRTRGRLSSWIVAIARSAAVDMQRARAARREHRGASVLGNLPEDGALEAVWDEECRRSILERAMRELRETTRLDARTIRAFEQVALEDRTPSEVAAELAISIDSVYMAKNRCLTQLREILARLNGLYEMA